MWVEVWAIYPERNHKWGWGGSCWGKGETEHMWHGGEKEVMTWQKSSGGMGVGEGGSGRIKKNKSCLKMPQRNLRLCMLIESLTGRGKEGRREMKKWEKKGRGVWLLHGDCWPDVCAWAQQRATQALSQSVSNINSCGLCHAFPSPRGWGSWEGREKTLSRLCVFLHSLWKLLLPWQSSPQYKAIFLSQRGHWSWMKLHPQSWNQDPPPRLCSLLPEETLGHATGSPAQKQGTPGLWGPGWHRCRSLNVGHVVSGLSNPGSCCGPSWSALSSSAGTSCPGRCTISL